MKRHVDALLASTLFVGYLALLLATCGSLGFMRDEGFYFNAARVYQDWLGLLLHAPAEALSRSALDRAWTVNHEHPSLMKLLFALSNSWFSGAFSQVSSSFRFPALVLSSLAVALTFDWGRRCYGRWGGLVAALSFGFAPAVFFHAHLACFDLPVCALWLVTSYVYVHSLSAAKRSWALAAGVCFGLLLDTKHNAWIFPFVVLLHFALAALLHEQKPRWQNLPKAWLAMAALGPLVFVALWPWLWHDTATRFVEYVRFHTQHEYYNMEFLGHTYWKPPMPRAYPWLMTLATVPAITLLLAALGAWRSPWRSARPDALFWAVSVAASYAPWLSETTPIFGGTKHWLTAYPFLCLFAGAGFAELLALLALHTPRFAQRLSLLLAVSVLVGPITMALHAHPFGLNAYTPLVGGASGAATLGLNRTFWGYTTQGLAPFINARTPKRGSVYVHDTALSSFAMFQEDGRLRRDLRGSLDIAGSDVSLYHHEPHMSRVEHQIWLSYGSVAPDAIVTFDGVPITWAYARRSSESSRH